MNEESDVMHDQLLLESAGGRLRRAREEAGKSVEQISGETRIPQRHIEAIETGDYSELPSRAHVMGFSRSYAKAVGLDENQIIAQVREEQARATGEDVEIAQKYEPGDPSRLPSRRLAWFAAFAVILLIAGAFSFYRTYFSPGLGPAPLTDPEAARVAQGEGADRPDARPSGPDPEGEVVFTSLEDGMWVRFYDGSEDNVLLEKLMAKGETFTIPADADDPQIRTGRPDAFGITIDGQPVPKLAENDFVMSDVMVSAPALLERSEGTADSTAAPSDAQTADET